MTTQKAFASYQEIIDLHTTTDRVSVLGFHTPSDNKPYLMLKGFFDTFRQYKYRGMSVTLVPAARLPADPSQVSYEAGEQPIDPRDLLNPILFHGCHGDDLGSILNQYYAGSGVSTTDFDRVFTDSVDKTDKSTAQIGDGLVYESLYYRALTDNTWLKVHPQRGFRKRMHPLVYDVSSNFAIVPGTNGSRAPVDVYPSAYNMGVQDGYINTDMSAAGTMGAGTTTNDTFAVSRSQGMATTVEKDNPDTDVGGKINVARVSSTHNGQAFFTSRCKPLGWLDTRAPILAGTSYDSGALTFNAEATASQLANLYMQIELDEKKVQLPKLFMGLCLLPPAYKTQQYFRLIINHNFSFRGYRGMSMRADMDMTGSGVNYAPTAFNLN